jgi:hypothetical protein
VPLIRGEAGSTAPVFSALYRPRGAELQLVSVRTRAAKLVHDLRSGSWMQFDLEADPGERQPLPVRDSALRELLASFAAQEARALAARETARSAAGTPPGLPAEATEELRELGYLE